MTVEIRLFFSQVSDLKRLSGLSNATHRGCAAHRGAPPQLDICRRQCSVECSVAAAISFFEPHSAVAGLAEPRRVCQHGLEHRLELAGRAGYDLQHLRRRGLLLERLHEVLTRLSQLAPACLKLLFQIGAGLTDTANARSRIRSGRTKFAAARWALCAFERQRSPRRYSHWFPSGRPSQGSSLSILTASATNLTPVHSITSSARASSVGGNVMPRTLAVIRLMISSTFTACWTGRSAGLSPLRMRPT